ncbi:MAG TPA: MFS transporter [Isosphaeraceae bacterium]|nr:MFS transporter [Isosphaeraceae bacterium]
MPDDAPQVSHSSRFGTFAALRIPEFRRFYIGQGVSLVGTWLQTAAVSWIVFDMTRSERISGIVDACGLLPGLFVGLVAGALADRVVPRTMVIAMQVGQMLLSFLLGALVGLGVVQIWQMALILALTRVCVTFEMPSRQVFQYDLVGRETLTNAIALNSGLFNASRVIGPALAGLCLARFGATACFVLNGISYLAAIGALLTIHVARKPHHVEPGGLKAVMGGFAFLKGDRKAATLFRLMAAFGIAGMGYMALVPAYAQRVVHTGPLGFSLLLAGGGLGATAGALLVATLGSLKRKEVLVLGGITVFAAFLAAAGLLPTAAARVWSPAASLLVASCCLFGAGFGAIVFFSATQTLIQTTVPDHLRGRIMGIWMIAYSGSVPLGSLWAGELANHYGVTLMIEISAVICFGMVLYVLASGSLIHPADVTQMARAAHGRILTTFARGSAGTTGTGDQEETRLAKAPEVIERSLTDHGAR